MSDLTNQNAGAVNQPPPVQPGVVQPDAQTAGLAASGNFDTIDSSTGVSSMKDLREKAPKLEKAMMMGIATNIINKMRDAEEHRKEMVREYQR